MWCWRRIEKLKWSEKVTNEQVIGRIGEKRTLLNILCRKANWIGHILRRNFLLHDAIQGLMTEVKEVGRRRTQLLDDLRNKKILGAKGGSWRSKKDGNDSLSIDHIFHNSLDLLISSILNIIITLILLILIIIKLLIIIIRIFIYSSSLHHISHLFLPSYLLSFFAWIKFNMSCVYFQLKMVTNQQSLFIDRRYHGNMWHDISFSINSYRLLPIPSFF